MRLDRALVLALFALACSERPATPRVTETRSPIIDGTADPAETGVVMISHRDYPFECSGTVVHPRLVVTAKHCTFRERNDTDDEPMPGDRFLVGFGPRIGELDWHDTERMAWIGMPAELDVTRSVNAGEDIALLTLRGAVPADTFLHDVDLDWVPGPDEVVTLGGYGRSSTVSSLSGVKLSTNDPVDAFDSTSGLVQTVGNGACFGDSGGPVFAGSARDLVGVISATTEQHCQDGLTIATTVRNDRTRQLIVDALAELGVCAPQREVCGDGVDQDCDGVADNACTKDGEPCAADVECEHGACMTIGGTRVCGRRCDEVTACPASMGCSSACGAGVCESESQGDAPLFASCSGPSDCASNHCSDLGCALVRRPRFGECPDDMACADAGPCSECRPLDEVPSPRLLGETCEVDEDCADEGQCVDDGFGVRRCAMPCFEGAACPGEYSCRGGLCLRTGGFSVGERCFEPEDCASLLCAVFDDPRQSFCTKPCTTTADCGRDSECVEQLGQAVCVPNGKGLGEECGSSSQCAGGRCHPGLEACVRPCGPTTAPCPPGFRCEHVDGELLCAAAEGAFDPPVSGQAGSAGSMATADAGGASGSSAGRAGAGARPGLPESSGDGGCSCSVRTDRSPKIALFTVLVALGDWRRRSVRRGGRSITEHGRRRTRRPRISVGS